MLTCVLKMACICQPIGSLGSDCELCVNEQPTNNQQTEIKKNILLNVSNARYCNTISHDWVKIRMAMNLDVQDIKWP